MQEMKYFNEGNDCDICKNQLMTGRDGTVEDWCDVQSLGTNEKYTALQAGLENTIVFKVRNCKRMKEVRKKMKEFYVEYDGTRFDIYDASPMFTDNGWVLVKCRAVA